jgi:hypothetical protein
MHEIDRRYIAALLTGHVVLIELRWSAILDWTTAQEGLTRR